MGKQAIVLFATAMAAALFMLGCGGGSASISKAEFTKKAEAACKKNEEELQKDFKAFVKKHAKVTEPTEADFAELVDVVFSGNIEAEMKELRAIEIPSGDEKQVEALLDAREESLEKAEAEPEEAITKSEKVFGKASKLAKEYGLEACSQR
jgi:iron-sulfur cluster repair protein YtfE (RIC family)